MKKALENIIFIGFISFFVGGLILVFTQFVGLIIGNPELMIGAENIEKFIFPVASVSGLLCFLYPYLIKRKNN